MHRSPPERHQKHGALVPPPASFEGNHPSSPKQLYDGHSPQRDRPGTAARACMAARAVLVAAVFLAYMRVWHAGFIWMMTITLPGIRASSVRSASGPSGPAARLFITRWCLPASGSSTPFGAESLPYHVVDVTLHAGCAVCSGGCCAA